MAKAELAKKNIPLYVQLEQILRSQITTGELLQGERIPTEKELSVAYHVSTITVRQAVLNLVKDGLLYRKQGRGTFVTDRMPPVKSLMTLKVKAGFGDLVPQWAEQEWKVIDIATMRAPNRVAECLDIGQGQPIVRIRRTRSEEGVPISYIRHFLPKDIGDRIDREDLLKYSMLDLMERRLGMSLRRGLQHVEAVNADHEIAAALAISLSSPILFLETIVFDNTDVPTQLAQSFYRSDRFRYTLDLNLEGRLSDRGVTGKQQREI